ncbi:sphingosine kinase 2-like [Helianthus annuus]|uniref:sphingosine kinase 2-like n=1 Tax=Helianthus annuus TaxID=4232 RepID=UPI000B8F6A45|nr:sphingosine kinase 2-like [Helianthus annuus]
MLAVIQGHKRSLDVATIWQGQSRFFSVLMLAWGLIADIDIESEQYRWMGSARMDLYVDRRYKQYYHQMQIIISSLQVIAEGRAAKTYTSLALETNSCRFRCLRDAIDSQVTRFQ